MRFHRPSVRSGTAAAGSSCLVVWLALLGGCTAGTAHDRYSFRELVMGVEARVVLYADNEPAARDAARAAFNRMHELDAVMSDYRNDSELMQLCRTHDVAVPVSDDLFNVLEQSLAISRATDGAFDVTAGPLVRVWRQARRDARLPDEADTEAAIGAVGFAKVALDAGHQTVMLAQPGMQLDLGGIGKGFAADAALALLRSRGFDCCLVDLGGDIAVGRAPPRKTGWAININPDQTLQLADAGVATSGSRYQFIEIDGVRYSHIVDPRTGQPVTHHRAVTVIAPDAATADALASAFSVMGLDAARSFAARESAITVHISSFDGQ